MSRAEYDAMNGKFFCHFNTNGLFMILTFINLISQSKHNNLLKKHYKNTTIHSQS